MTSAVDLSADDFEKSPWSYPGAAPAQSGLLLGGAYLPLVPQNGRRLGQSRILIEGGELTDRLNTALLTANVASADHRYLVVAIGSNSSPAVMRRKFARGGVSTVVPFIKAIGRGYRVGHSAHVSRPGYLAATPILDRDAATPVVASLLDREQLACLDATEPNYRRLQIVERQLPLELEGGEHPEAYFLYDSRWGVITQPGADPWNLVSQDEVIERLFAGCPNFANLLGTQHPREALQALGGNQDLREAVRNHLQANGWVSDSGLSAMASGITEITYGATPSVWDGQPRPAGLLACLPSRDSLDRSGEQCVSISPTDAAHLQVGTHAALSTVREHSLPAVVARVVVLEDQGPGTAGVDQVLRNALGVELQEPVSLRSATVARTPMVDALVAKSHFSMLRVQTADLATVEQNVALMSPLAMSILGLENGDEAVVEGSPGNDGRVPELRLNIHAAPEETITRRESLSGGGLTSRFPSTREALGVHPDLPWLFLDSTSRSALGITSQKLGAVRVRASRRYQVAREVRELLFLLVLAVVGLASIVESVTVLVVVLIMVLVLALAVTRHRLKHRLETND